MAKEVMGGGKLTTVNLSSTYFTTDSSMRYVEKNGWIFVSAYLIPKDSWSNLQIATLPKPKDYVTINFPTQGNTTRGLIYLYTNGALMFWNTGTNGNYISFSYPVA